MFRPLKWLFKRSYTPKEAKQNIQVGKNTHEYWRRSEATSTLFTTTSCVSHTYMWVTHFELLIQRTVLSVLWHSLATHQSSKRTLFSFPSLKSLPVSRHKLLFFLGFIEALRNLQSKVYKCQELANWSQSKLRSEAFLRQGSTTYFLVQTSASVIKDNDSPSEAASVFCVFFPWVSL